MPYSTISSGSDSFVPREPGVYVKDSVTFSDPTKELRVRGATRNKDKSLSGSLVYVEEKDVTNSAGATKRVSMIVTVAASVTPDFTEAQVKAGIKALYDFSQTTGFTSRWLQGES